MTNAEHGRRTMAVQITSVQKHYFAQALFIGYTLLAHDGEAQGKLVISIKCNDKGMGASKR